MPFVESTTTVTTAPTALGSNGLQGRARIMVFAAGNVWVGSSTVTTATGYAIASNAGQEFAAPQGVGVYGVTNTGTVVVRTIEIG